MFWRTFTLASILSLLSPGAEQPASRPLFEAIQKNDSAAVSRLLNSGLGANARDADDTPALMDAALQAGPDVVKILLEHAADPNAADKAGLTALMWAVPDAAVMKLLIDAGANVNAQSTTQRRTPLLIAATYPSSTAALQLLLDHGADIHAKDRLGVHALGRAALSGDVAVVRFLVEHGCDPGEPGYGTTVRYARQYLPTLEYLMSKGMKVEKDALAMAAHWQDPKLLEAWIERGADVNATAGPYKRTALMTAASSEQASAATVKLLLERGADPERRRYRWRTPSRLGHVPRGPEKNRGARTIRRDAWTWAASKTVSASAGRRHRGSSPFGGTRRQSAAARGPRAL